MIFGSPIGSLVYLILALINHLALAPIPAPWRAGGLEGNHLSHSSFIPAKSTSPASTTVTLTILLLGRNSLKRSP